MKLKQRLVLLTVIAACCLLSMACITFYYTYSYHNGVELVTTLDDPVLRMKLRLLEQDRLRPSKRKLNKKLSNVTPDNSSAMYDSNRAVEVPLNESEYDDWLRKKDPLAREFDKSETNRLKKMRKGTRLLRETDRVCSKYVMQQESGKKREKFPDLLQFLENKSLHEPDPRRLRVTLQEIHGIADTHNLSLLQQFHVGISDLDLYPKDDPNVEKLLNTMATLPIVHVEEKQGGTQLKLIITFNDGSQALFKPMRFDRDKETEPNHFYFVDYERHTAEIAAFHLDRILGFRRCPPVVGRKLNITSEIYAVTEDELIKTFFISPAQNICFHGTCSYYCDTSHAICGKPDTVEGSLAAFLPPDSLSGRKSWKNPWRRSYHKRRKAEFEKNPAYCDVVRNQRSIYKNSKRLADLVDVTILDFLIGNMDRHHYETFKVFGNDSFILHLDHGRGFGKPSHDEISILAPLYQCCFVSFRTFQQLMQLQHGPYSLSVLMRCSLSKDPVAPILLEKHLRALDRRLEIVLSMIKSCLQTHSHKSVFFHEPLL